MYFSRYHIIAKVQKRCSISNVTYFLYYAICSHLIDTDGGMYILQIFSFLYVPLSSVLNVI